VCPDPAHPNPGKKRGSLSRLKIAKWCSALTAVTAATLATTLATTPAAEAHRSPTRSKNSSPRSTSPDHLAAPFFGQQLEAIAQQHGRTGAYRIPLQTIRLHANLGGVAEGIHARRAAEAILTTHPAQQQGYLVGDVDGQQAWYRIHHLGGVVGFIDALGDAPPLLLGAAGADYLVRVWPRVQNPRIVLIPTNAAR